MSTNICGHSSPPTMVATTALSARIPRRARRNVRLNGLPPNARIVEFSHSCLLN